MFRSSVILVIHVLALSCSTVVEGQVYAEKQTRHRFAQTMVGLDFHSSWGGRSSYLNQTGAVEYLSLENSLSPRAIIGGTHFWGHADFFIAIPLYHRPFRKQGQHIANSVGVETGLKVYPWRVEDRKIRPYVGISLFPYFYSQDNKNANYSNGPEKTYVRIPLLAGFTYNHNRHVMEMGLTYKYNNDVPFHISAEEKIMVETPALYFSLSYRYTFDTTLSAEEDWQSGRTKEITRQLGKRGALNGFYAGAALSSAWWLGRASYNIKNRPYIPNYGTSVMPDVALGYYFHRPDLNASILYRGYSKKMHTYGIQQQLQRKSIGIEFTKSLFDYHGFVPFVGPVLSVEHLSFDERNTRRGVSISEKDTRLGYGLTFGWDIRPNRLQWFILRTNLRYFPGLVLHVQDDAGIRFSNIEFNFIQLLIFPNRLL